MNVNVNLDSRFAIGVTPRGICILAALYLSYKVKDV